MKPVCKPTPADYQLQKLCILARTAFCHWSKKSTNTTKFSEKPSKSSNPLWNTFWLRPSVCVHLFVCLYSSRFYVFCLCVSFLPSMCVCIFASVTCRWLIDLNQNQRDNRIYTSKIIQVVSINAEWLGELFALVGRYTIVCYSYI